MTITSDFNGFRSLHVPSQKATKLECLRRRFNYRRRQESRKDVAEAGNFKGRSDFVDVDQ